MGETQQDEQAVSLSQRLRSVSFGGHGGDESWTGDGATEPEEPRYATAYMRGGLNRAGIAAQAAHHFLMYEAIESAAEVHRARLGESFAFWRPELHRLPSVIADLEYWIGDDWEREVRGRYRTPGIVAYVERLEEVAPNSLPLFVAHHYTRYLADLSGGQMIARAFARSYGIEGDEGVRFYRFTQIEDPRSYKDAYREMLDSAEFTEAEQRLIADEVALAYRLNNLAGADLEARFEEFAA